MKNERNPQISVIMGIYNCAETLPAAVESILRQTFADWELIMCDDGSADGTYSAAEMYKNKFPSKIVLLKNAGNKGLNYTLNRCLKAAKGRYIARMDGDDYCLPERFELELKVFRDEPDISIVSTDMGYFDDTGIWGRISHPEYPAARDFLAGTPFCHAPCLVKKEAYDRVGGYTENRKLLRVEDYHLWIKMYRAGFAGKNIHQQLYFMRDDREAYRRRKFKYRLNEVYVRAFAVRELKLPAIGYILSLRQMVVGLLPAKLYNYLHKWILNKNM